MKTEKARAILLLSCPDQRGIVASVSNFIFGHKGNILHADQHTTMTQRIFFMRIEWELEGFDLSRKEIGPAFGELAERFGMKWELHFTDKIPRMALFVSKHVHCLNDILLRYQMGEIRADISAIISNHQDLKQVAEQHGIAFLHFPISSENKASQEKAEILELRRRKIDFIVLARYMQVLTNRFVAAYPSRIINIHHSFLPAFAGADPYQQAYDRGVKIIGATSHYVTEQLDEGPIIAQDVIKISHRDSADEMRRKGKDLERIVLAKAVRLHLERRILVHGSKTIVFE
jgi:formyltetrahydrofolate deformylase